MKLSDDYREIILEEAGYVADYEDLKQKLLSAKAPDGSSRPSYAVYEVQYDLEGEGHREVITFISYVDETTTRVKSRMIFASSLETLKDALSGIYVHVQATDLDTLRWAHVLNKASNGKIPDTDA